jgi:hypothetical protein
MRARTLHMASTNFVLEKMGPTEGISSESPLPGGSQSPLLASSESPPTDGISSKSPLLGLPNELFFEVASHLKSFKDLNSLARTSHFFHGMLNTDLYRRAVAAKEADLDDIVGSVLMRCRPASLALLLDHGLSVNHSCLFAGSADEETMLCFLCRLDQVRAVPFARLLIQRGADLEVKDAIRSETVLYRAIQHHCRDIAELLLAHGADAGVQNTYGETALHLAARWSRGQTHEVAKSLLEHGAAVTATDRRGETPLHTASHAPRNWGLVMAEFLLENGADVNAVSNDGLRPLHLALYMNNQNVAALLLAHGADVNASNDGLFERRAQSIAARYL